MVVESTGQPTAADSDDDDDGPLPVPPPRAHRGEATSTPTAPGGDEDRGVASSTPLERQVSEEGPPPIPPPRRRTAAPAPASATGGGGGDGGEGKNGGSGNDDNDDAAAQAHLWYCVREMLAKDIEWREKLRRISQQLLPTFKAYALDPDTDCAAELPEQLFGKFVQLDTMHEKLWDCLLYTSPSPRDRG